MKNMKNNLLLFKQSSKSIFKFKIQFLSILLLSFMSVLVLTSSLTIKDRLNQTYNAVVGDVEKFDYQVSDQFSFIKGETSSDKVAKQLMLSFLPDDSRTIVDGKETININFNSIYGRTFITDAFEKDQRMLNVFRAQQYNKNGWRTFNSNAFFWTTRILLLESLYADLDLYYNGSKDDVAYLNTTPIVSYINTLENKSFIANDLAQIRQNLDKIDFYQNISDEDQEFSWNNLNNYDQQINDLINIQNKEFYIYSSNAIATIIAYIKDYESKFSSKMESSESWKSGVRIFQFLTGQDLSEKNVKNINENWIVTDNNKLSDSIISNQPKGDGENFIELKSSETTTEEIFEVIFAAGLKGKSTPITASWDNENKIIRNASIKGINLNPLSMNSNIEGDDWANKFSAFNNTKMSDDYFKELFSQRGVDWVVWDQGNYSLFSQNSPLTNNMANNYRMYLKVAAAYSNLNIEFRKEFNIFDNSNQIQFKSVVLDEYNHTKIKILNEAEGGRFPIHKGEILISPQYAKAHKIKNNTEIKIGPQVFTVVGIAADTFSYYPLVDENLPIPQYNNSAIIYATEETFFPIIENSESSLKEQIVNTKINYFLWNNQGLKVDNIKKFTSLNPLTTSMKSFEESYYRLNWILQPSIASGLLLFMILISVIVGIISLLGVVIYVKKMIRQNIKQIAILKAMGIRSFPIACSYAVIGLIILCVIIPIAWVLGTFTQLIFIKMFIPYFSIELSQLSISISGLLIGLFAFGLITIILSTLFAFIETKEDVTLMLNKVGKVKQTSFMMKWINSTFANSKFTLRFSLIISASSIKNTITTSSIIFISSFLVFFGLSIPASIQTTKNGYYKHLNYNNQHIFDDNVYNAPLSKSTISYTEDLAKIDKNFKQTSLIDHYADPTYSYNSSFDVSPISKYIYSKNKNNEAEIINTFKYLVNDKSNSKVENNDNNTGLFQLLTEQFGNNFANGIGSQFSVGMIDQALSVIMNSYYDATAYGTTAYTTINTDIQNNVKFNMITKNLTDAIPMILGAILGSSAGESTGNWKDDILSIILKNVPPFVEKYLQDPSRKEQYGFGYNVKKVTKNYDSLATNIISNTQEHGDLKLTGINSNQVAFDLPSDQIFTSDKTANLIEMLINNQWDMTKSIMENGFVYYAANSKTLSIPVMPNNQAKNAYALKMHTTLNNAGIYGNQLKFAGKEENTFLSLPKQAWIYDDTDFLNSDYYKNSLVNKDSKELIINNRTGTLLDTHYLDPSDLDNNKFTYKIMYTNTDNLTSLDNNAYMFNDFAVNDNQEGISYLRPYYEYENIELYIPQNLIAMKDANGTYNWANWAGVGEPNNLNYFKADIANADVPQIVKQAWESMYKTEATDSAYIKIKPYSLSYKRDNYKNIGLGNIVDKKSNYVWYANAMRDGLLKQEKDMVKYLNSDININFKVVDVLNSYNSSLILMDQKLANIIANYSTAKKQDVKNNIFEDNPKVKAGETIIDETGNEIISKFDRYELHDDNEDVYLNDWTNMLSEGEASTNYTQYMWSNAKFSNINESIDLTTGIWYTVQENNGLVMLGQSPLGNISNNYLTTGIKSSKLFSTEKELIKQLTNLGIVLGAFFIIIVIITASLLIMLIGDIYIASLERFMVLMKSFGYSNWKVQKYSFGVVSVLSTVAWIVSTLLATGAMSSVSLIFSAYGLAIPTTITLWPFIVSAVIIGFAFFESLSVITRKIRKGDPAGLLNETHE